MEFKNSFVPRGTEGFVKNQEIPTLDHFEEKYHDVPRMPEHSEWDRPYSEKSTSIFDKSAKIFDEALKRFGVSSETADDYESKNNEGMENKNDNSSDLPEKRSDGKYYDKETGDVYASPEDWKKGQETLAKHYYDAADYNLKRSEKEFNRFQNAKKNGESDQQKMRHFQRSKEFYSKAEECRKKADRIAGRIGLSDISDSIDKPVTRRSDLSNENNNIQNRMTIIEQGENSDQKENRDSIKQSLDNEAEKKPDKMGGSYKEVFNGGEGDKYEVHHIPADTISPLERNDGPAIKMEKEDHANTASYGNSRHAREYREKQKELIDKGKFSDAIQMDIDDIHEKFGDKYDDAIAQMQEYVDKIKSEGKINE